jgi:hypothetical protein
MTTERKFFSYAELTVVGLNLLGSPGAVTGSLHDRMLRDIGLSRTDVYVAARLGRLHWRGPDNVRS